MTDFTDEQQAALATLTVLYPHGAVVVNEDEIAVCESLVKSGHVVRVETDELEGNGYQLSEAMAEAHRRVMNQRADEAGMN